MGCGCGKGLAPIRKIQPVKMAPPDQFKKIVQIKPNYVPLKIQNNPIQEVTFQTIKISTNPLSNSEKKKLILITKEGNAESSYIRNLILKFYNITDEYKKGFEIYELNHQLISDASIQSVPATVLSYKDSHKIYYGIFDVKRALNDLIKM